MNRLVLSILLCIYSITGVSQLVLVPIKKEISSKQSNTARTRSVDPIILPFWDDFSASRSGYADSTKWQYGNSVWVNSGMGINPPSLNVATFDGLDSLGKPYNVNDVLAKGFADKLISAPVRMDLPSASERTAISITFFYQYHGNGEPPDMGDIIRLLFKNSSGQWEVVWTKENDGTLENDKFIRVTIPITDTKYFHDTFQFQFQNFARLSGPYDTWHLDYIYISNGKPQTGTVFPLFPDRTIVTPFTSLFDTYRAMPIKHFFSDPAANLTKPSITINNLRQDQVGGNGQVVNYNSSAIISMTKEGQSPITLNPTLDVKAEIIPQITFNEYREVVLQTIPDPTTFNTDADSINITLKIDFVTKDDLIKTSDGDYDFDVFNPIKFRNNDTLSAQFILSDYYAYDDGSAEYGAGLNQPGAQIAYQFDLKTPDVASILAVDIYFPRFGDESNQIIQFQILKNLTSNVSDILYQGNIPIQRNSQNKFWRIQIPIDAQPILIKDRFYIGWKQLSSAVIAVGLDKNTDSGSMIYSNINGTWEQNLNLKGSLMIHPIFGESDGVISGVEDKVALDVYPNPTKGVFSISGVVDDVSLVDLTGRRIPIIVEKEAEATRVTISAPAAGLYVLRTSRSGRWSSSKLIVY